MRWKHMVENETKKTSLMFDFYPTCLEKTKHVGIFTPGCFFPHMFGFWHIGMGKGTHVWKKPHNYMFANVWHCPYMCGKSHWHAYFPLSYGWTLVMLWYYLICSLDRQALWVEFVIQPRSTSSPFVTIRVWPIIHSNSAQIGSTIKGLFHQDSEHCKNIARIANAVQVTKGSREKKLIFYGQADHKGWGVSHLGPDRKQMWKFWPIFFNGMTSLSVKARNVQFNFFLWFDLNCIILSAI